ncbi:MAG: VacJ family lipoprotein [Verrucomicrobia bacterium]|nr:VacJ family lipoprotein [Verrucomicrobiota bacterium]
MDELFDEDMGLATPGVQDPFESVNRAVFKFNDFIYLNVLDPVSSGYEYITPDAVEEKLSNSFDNLNFPVRLAGNLLQGKFEGALLESGTFLLNSTVGFAGLNRPSEKLPELKSLPKEDIGQALGAWGLGNGPYLVLPVLGPSSLRDLAGRIGDRVVDPFQNPLVQVDEWEIRTAYSVGGAVVKGPSLVQRYKQMKGGSLDPYVALRNGYFHYRTAAVKE